MKKKKNPIKREKIYSAIEDLHEKMEAIRSIHKMEYIFYALNNGESWVKDKGELKCQK